MKNYRFGPFPRGGNDEWGFAKALVVSLWDTFWAIAEEREKCWNAEKRLL